MMIHKKTILFIGQALPKQKDRIPYGKTRLYSWFEKVGWSKEQILAVAEFDAVMSVFPGRGKNGRDRMPTHDDVKHNLGRLKKRICKLRPRLVIPVGTTAAQVIFGNSATKLRDVIGRKFEINPLSALREKTAVIPLPHPSGLSTWVYDEENKLLLEKALLLIRQEQHKW